MIMKRRDFYLVRDVLRHTTVIDSDQRRRLAREFGEAIAAQPGTDPRFDAGKFEHEVTRSGPDRRAETYDPARDPRAARPCRHCSRDVVLIDGTWIDPHATGDDSVWRETCDANDTFTAQHEVADLFTTFTDEPSWSFVQPRPLFSDQ